MLRFLHESLEKRTALTRMVCVAPIITLLVLVLVLALVPGPPAMAQQDQPASMDDENASDHAPRSGGLEFFESRIRPVLVEHCYQCHSAEIKTPKGGLRVDSRSLLRQGGDSGHAVVPGRVEDSLIISALKYEMFEMPPTGKLDERIIEDFEAWIEMGAPDPRERPTPRSGPRAAVDVTEARRTWTFRAPVAAEVPNVGDEWAVNEVDRFLLAAQTKRGVTHADDALPAQRLRRVYFDLIGLPPTPEEIAAFVNDPSPAAYARVVDQLLQSPRFGERWGRHWLDVVRYAESTGKTRNFPFPLAWKYRDYVIDAFNRDVPYDQFLREQIAGDLMPADSREARARLLTATGFLALGAVDLNERDRDVYRMDVVGDQVDVLCRSTMGLTVGCARCHDHKFDPISQRDFTALAGIFLSTETLNGYGPQRRNPPSVSASRFLRLPGPDDDFATFARASLTDAAAQGSSKKFRDVRQQLLKLRQELKQLDSQATAANSPGGARRTETERRDLIQRRQRMQSLLGQMQQMRQTMSETMDAAEESPADNDELKDSEYAMGVRDFRRPLECPLYEGGDVARAGVNVPRGFPQVLQLTDSPVPSEQSGRMELAAWLTRPDHPLTARVMVNRIWHHLFGSGIVPTVDNFGAMGSRPSQPELLDYLAVRFVNEGWSTKRLIRLIVISRAYQQSGAYDAENAEIDGDNETVWRMPPRRLEAEAIHDALLTMSGQLELTPPVGSLVQEQPLAMVRGKRQGDPRVPLPNVRTVYLPVVRSRLPEYLTAFDFPEPSDVKGSRDVTTVSTQALFLMNNPQVETQCRVAAGRLMTQSSDPREFVRQAYLMTLSREPTPEQIDRAVEFVREVRRSSEDRPRLAMLQAAADLLHALVASAEFRYH